MIAVVEGHCEMEADQKARVHNAGAQGSAPQLAGAAAAEGRRDLARAI